MGLYAGDVGLYAGEVGLYAGEVGLYAGDAGLLGLKFGLSGLYRGEVGLKAGLDPPPIPGDTGELWGLNEPPENGLVATGEKALAPNGVLMPGLAPGLNL